MTKSAENFCSLCGRREHQVRSLKPRDLGFICEDCASLQMAGATEAAMMRNRDPSINDAYQRHKVESATKLALQKEFQTKVAEPKDPEKPRVAANENGNGFQAHPLLKDKVQFNGANETTILPNMDPEQWEHYLEYQLQLKNELRLQNLNQQTMRPQSPG